MAITFTQSQSAKVIIESVIPLTSAQLDDARVQLGLNKDIEIINQKNSELVAGIRVRVNGKVVDLSLQHMLDQLKESDNE